MKGQKNRLLYLLYYFKQLDRYKARKFMDHVVRTTGRSRMAVWFDIIRSVFRYNIGIMDYYLFRFYEKTPEEREKWAGTGFMYEYHLDMNPLDTRNILADKLDFYEAYPPFIKHAHCTIDDLKEDSAEARSVLANPKGKLVVKDALGQCGWDVEVWSADMHDRKGWVQYMQQKGFNIAEEFILQHSELRRMSDSGLNTIRVITQLNSEGGVDYLGARLRISVNSHVDNLASGNMAAPVDIQTGIVTGPAVFSDITKEDLDEHPVTGVRVTGFQIPYWNEVLEMTKNAALHRPENRSIGWDVAITDQGPELIEGNHNWCKLLWQLPVHEGLKHMLDPYRN